MTLLHEHITHQIIGAFFEVYNTLGHGFLESVYAEAMTVELAARHMPFQREWPFPVIYKGTRIGVARADLVVANSVVVELKAVDRIAGAHDAQLFNYLKASKLQVGLILNFGRKAEKRRIIWTGSHGTIDDARPGIPPVLKAATA
jgi:GxxExxY protein